MRRNLVVVNAALVTTSLDTLGLLTVAAGDCSGRMGGQSIDCSTDALADDLEAP